MIKVTTILAVILIAITPIIAQESSDMLTENSDISIESNDILIDSNDISIVKELSKPTDDGTSVQVYQDPKLAQQLILHVEDGKQQEIIGYRIQVFSDNSQKNAKVVAQQRANQIQSLEPTEKVYITFNSPFWRVRVGNYTTYEEAVIKLREFKKEFPKYSDMRIVKDIIDQQAY